MGRQKKTVTMFAEPVIKTTRSLVYKYRCSACGHTIGIEDQQAVARLALGQSLPVRGCAAPGCTLGADGGPYSISESSLATASQRDPRVEQMIQEFKSRIRMAAVQSVIGGPRAETRAVQGGEEAPRCCSIYCLMILRGAPPHETPQ